MSDFQFKTVKPYGRRATYYVKLAVFKHSIQGTQAQVVLSPQARKDLGIAFGDTVGVAFNHDMTYFAVNPNTDGYTLVGPPKKTARTRGWLTIKKDEKGFYVGLSEEYSKEQVAFQDGGIIIKRHAQEARSNTAADGGSRKGV